MTLRAVLMHPYLLYHAASESKCQAFNSGERGHPPLRMKNNFLGFHPGFILQHHRDLQVDTEKLYLSTVSQHIFFISCVQFMLLTVVLMCGINALCSIKAMNDCVTEVVFVVDCEGHDTGTGS